MLIWKQFQKIYAISLASRTDLADAMSLAATLTGLDIEIVAASDGSELTNKSLPDGADEVNLRMAELGCWRSHMNILRM